MEQARDKQKRKKYFIAAGAACLPNAVMFICYAIFAVIYFVQSLGSIEIRDHGYLIVYVVAIIFQTGLRFIYILSFVVFGALAAVYIMCFISMMSRDECKAKSAAKQSLGLSAAVGAFSLYPFIINLCRIAVHGFQNHYIAFFVTGLIPFTLSVLCVALGAIAVKKESRKVRS